MFERETVFILGAGASFSYGYPLGKYLIKNIIRNIEKDTIYLSTTDLFLQEHNFSNFKQILKDTSVTLFENPLHPSNSSFFTPSNSREIYMEIKIKQLQQFNALKQALIDFDPVSIDAFLRDHPSHETAGKIMIIYSLLKNENKEKTGISGNNDNWYSCLINDIFSGCDDPKNLLNNKLNIITFNYDVSLEFCLYKKIQTTERFKQDDISSNFIKQLQKDCITHVYGKLYTADAVSEYGNYFSESNKPTELNTKRFITAIKNENEIKLIDGRKNIEKSHTDNIKTILSNAKEIIIIGFGFDRDNLTILGFPNRIADYKNFLKNCDILKYMDHGGRMNSLHEQFQKIQAEHPKTKIMRSIATSITDAYQNDFKIHLYQN